MTNYVICRCDCSRIEQIAHFASFQFDSGTVEESFREIADKSVTHTHTANTEEKKEKKTKENVTNRWMHSDWDQCAEM